MLTQEATKDHRRGFLSTVASGLKTAALCHLFQGELQGFQETATNIANSGLPSHPPEAKSVIHLFMNGGPSQMDLFDPKEALTKHHGKEHFSKIANEVEFPAAAGALMKSPFRFKRHGESGMWVSEVMPYFSKMVDDVSLIRSMHTTNLTHEPAIYKIQSGVEFEGKPVLGSWITYALGSENENLPAYVVMDDPRGLPVNGVDNWQAGFLPPNFQGVRFRGTGTPVLNLKKGFEEPDSITQIERSFLESFDKRHAGKRPFQPKLAARLKSYQLAAKMQIAATDALDLSKETSATKKMYGMDRSVSESYGRRCLIARRLIERGVRFVQLFIDSQIWDNHANIGKSLKEACERTDQPIAGLLADLKQRGLWDQTLVVWGGEIGRLPIAQLSEDKDPAKSGRDHNKNAMVSWFAGAGIQKGKLLGKTDELGFAAVENRVSVEDWHATILNRMGIHHDHLFYPRNGLNEKLTGVTSPRVISEILT
ncbi:DUF1501 domain-containing protein [Pirellulaceae bacterium]|jgi:hypothetical protein|nr:DUF1501 domain-containing protein [Pirellulaceae bacterium]